jgi:Amidase
MSRSPAVERSVRCVFGPRADPRDERLKLDWYLEPLSRRDVLFAAWERYFGDVDALFLPAAMTTAFAHSPYGAGVAVDGKTVSYFEATQLLSMCNLIGIPALAVPAGLDAQGLPIGLQIGLRRAHDRRDRLALGLPAGVATTAAGAVFWGSAFDDKHWIGMLTVAAGAAVFIGSLIAGIALTSTGDEAHVFERIGDE